MTKFQPSNSSHPPKPSRVWVLRSSRSSSSCQPFVPPSTARIWLLNPRVRNNPTRPHPASRTKHTQKTFRQSFVRFASRSVATSIQTYRIHERSLELRRLHPAFPAPVFRPRGRAHAGPTALRRRRFVRIRLANHRHRFPRRTTTRVHPSHRRRASSPSREHRRHRQRRRRRHFCRRCEHIESRDSLCRCVVAFVTLRTLVGLFLIRFDRTSTRARDHRER